ncbi:MAG: hydroxymethylbilane synthase [Chloroflexota bacterium]
MSARTFVVGTRGSRLALVQTELALDALRKATSGANFETRAIQTSGDKSTQSLSEIGGRGVFVIEIERALLAGEIDIAVHSLKDLPSEETPGLTIAGVLPREDPRDALFSRNGETLAQLPTGSTVATGSPRRAVQVLAARPDLIVSDIRGNVDTRMRKVEEGQYDAVVLAAAGLKRLGWLERASEIFDAEAMVPAVGQGALAVQTRSDDAETLALVGAADDWATRAAVTAERAFERKLGGGCAAAIGAHGTIAGKGKLEVGDRSPLLLRGFVGQAGGRILRAEMEGVAAEAEMLGVRLAEYMIGQGAAQLLEAVL